MRVTEEVTGSGSVCLLPWGPGPQSEELLLCCPIPRPCAPWEAGPGRGGAGSWVPCVPLRDFTLGGFLESGG